jgi:hypothetical protein
MLIALRKQEYLSVLDEWVGNPDFDAFVYILGEILTRGDHVVDAVPALLYRFSRWNGLSDVQRDAFQGMARRVIQRRLPVEQVTDGLVITGPAGPSSDPPHRPDRPIRWHRRDWTWLRRRGRLERAVLGGENLDDAKWFEWLGMAWAARLRLHSPSTVREHGTPYSAYALRLRCRGLGGSTAWQEVPHEAAEGDPVLCILDSDRDHPQAELGGTARKLDAALKATPDVQRLLHVEHLLARDVENVIPLELVRAAGDEPQWLAPMEVRGFFARPELDVMLAYLDVSKVQCERRLLDTKDVATKRYRETALARIRALDVSCTASASTCERLASGEPECSPKDVPPPSCVIVHSIGKPLRRILEVLDAEQETATSSKNAGSVAAWIASMLPNDDPAVLTPARLAWSWGLCSPPPIRSAP